MKLTIMKDHKIRGKEPKLIAGYTAEQVKGGEWVIKDHEQKEVGRVADEDMEKVREQGIALITQ